MNEQNIPYIKRNIFFIKKQKTIEDTKKKKKLQDFNF